MILNEIFESIQGEGLSVGTRALFVRLYGCDKNCDWCDTDNNKRSWEGSPRTLSDWICREILARKVKSIIITGGEPCIWENELIKLLYYLQRDCKGINLYMETNGEHLAVYKAIMEEGIEIGYTFSPKPPSSGDAIHIPYLSMLLNFAELLGGNSQFKFVLGKQDISWFAKIMLPKGFENLAVIQPLWNDNFADYRELYKMLSENFPQYRVIPQVHKLLKLQ